MLGTVACSDHEIDSFEAVDSLPTNSVRQSAEQGVHQSGSLPIVSDLIIDATASADLTFVGDQVFFDDIGERNIIGTWDITGPWDSVDNDIAYLVVSESDDGEIVAALYDYDGDEAGSGDDCFHSPTTGLVTFHPDAAGPIINGPYPLNGILSVANGGNFLNMLMLDLLDVDNDGNHNDVIEYRATRTDIGIESFEQICT